MADMAAPVSCPCNSSTRYSITNKPLEISIGASGPTGQDKTLKQRIVFAGIIEKSFRKKGYLTTVQLQGEDGKTIKVYWPGLGLPLVEQMISNEQLITDFREMGFKKLVLWNHYNTWNVDLKN
jgi:hypothetical protein